MDRSSRWSFYQNNSKVAWAGFRQYPNGLLCGLAPCHVIDINTPGKCHILEDVLLKDNILILNRNYRSSDEQMYDNKEILGLLKVRSHRELARKARLISVRRDLGRYKIEYFVAQKNGSFEGEHQDQMADRVSMNLQETVEILLREFKEFADKSAT